VSKPDAALLTRRSLLTSAAALGAAPAARLLAREDPKSAAGLLIDGCGAPGDPAAEDAAELSPRAVADARASGITAVNVTVGPVGGRPSLAAFEGIFRDIARWEEEIARHSEAFLRVTAARNLEAARATRRVGLVYGLQDGVAFQDDLSRLPILHRFGVRIIQPTYNLRNLLGDGCLEPDSAGLSRAGQEAIRRMNELGILVDLSHCGRQTTRDALTASSKPTAFTHTGCAAVADHPRNKTDDELKALADRGGVAGIYFMPYLRPSGQPMAEDVVRHVEHAVRVAGEDHVGVGTDGVISRVELTAEYRARAQADIDRRKKAGIGAPGEVEGVYTFVPDLNTPRRLQKLGELLSARGHGTARVEKILGGNFARLFREVWKEPA
jgi:membrane dipeptidase